MSPSYSKAFTDFLSKVGKIFIANSWKTASGNNQFNTFNPGNGQVLATLSNSGKEDVNEAVAMGKAYLSKRALSPSKRAFLLNTLASLLERDKRLLAEIECFDNGKPMNKAMYDVEGAIAHFRYYAGWSEKIEGSTIPVDQPNTLVYTRRVPMGVVGLIVPWNFPLMMAAWKLAPALACGNACILKPAEQTSLSSLYLAQLTQEAGFPKGWLSVLTGDGTTGTIMSSHPEIDKIGFTGSTAVGRKIMAAAASSNLKHVTLELGGKSPNIIFQDANLAKVKQSALWSSFYNSGQECTLGSRLYVHTEVYNDVVDALVSQAKALSVGPGWENPDLGPLISNQQVERVCGFIDQGKKEAKLRLGGSRIQGTLKDGYFVEPTIFETESHDAVIVQEEIFGPVVTVTRFDSEAEVLSLANDSQYGLAAGIWTNDLSRAHRVAEAVQSGTIWVNGYDMFSPAVPFGGMKLSGIGREMGKSALDLYTQEKAIWIKL